jgi:hypothetical protein
MLQRYTWAKHAEHLFKSLVLCRDAHGISSVPPDEYAARMAAKFRNILVDMEDPNSL